ncbi:MAG TPA: L-histidine N(alpha)-methyltransferase [Gemmatimonadaceae bacterium]|nr:L-histidine N(alpha)-methyltransferase [Gemmatimonadaceae bacterium]
MTAAAIRPQSPLLDEVRDGLSRPQKELSPTLFYDRRGSELFEEITQLPEYYLTRTERALLASRMPPVIARLRPRTLVELGAGSAAKTRLLLDAMRASGEPATYVPVDVSAEFLRETALALGTELPGLRVVPVVADISAGFGLPRAMPRPVLFAFLGSTIGNFDEDAAIALLRRVRESMCPGDHFLLGVDLRKDVHVIEAAYNDASGVTAEFNRNVLRVLNRELGADFDERDFAHRAWYNRVAHRIEMHLIARRTLDVHIPHVGTVPFRAGESIRTEISCKYDGESVQRLFHEAGLILDEWIANEDPAYALAIGSPEGWRR